MKGEGWGFGVVWVFVGREGVGVCGVVVGVFLVGWGNFFLGSEV